MNLLLDTNALIWWLGDDSRLGAEARARIGDGTNTVAVSVASGWEIAIKFGLGRLELAAPPEDFLEAEIAGNGFRLLRIGLEEALLAGALPHHHRDPFDRLLIAQTRVNGLTFVTADRMAEAYEVSILAADR